MTNSYFYEPAEGHGLAHDPTTAIVAPRPIGWISTTSLEGKRNLAPYSFFNLFGYKPTIVGFSSIGVKDSVANARDTGEFVWNMANDKLADAMNLSSLPVGPEVDEFELAGLMAAPSRLVRPARVAQSPAAFECRTIEVIQLRSHSGDLSDQWLVLGEVVGVHIDEAMIEDGVFRTTRARPIARGGGTGDYFVAGEESAFFIARPQPPA